MSKTLLWLISSDEKKEDWVKAIAVHKLEQFPQVSFVKDLDKYAQGENNKEDIDRKYWVNGIPLYLLLDKEGRIIKMWEGYGEQIEKEMDETLRDIFNK